MTTKPPLIFRVMLISIFLPLFLAWGALGVFGFRELSRSQEIGPMFATCHLGLPAICWGVFLFLLPLLCGIGIFLSGRWRRPVLCCVFVILAFALLSEIFPPWTPPNKREITFSLYGSGFRMYKDGTDVYCNGVHLGQTPLRLTVEELLAKVTPWDVPPSQPWLKDDAYTWMPWDDFREERYDKANQLYDQFWKLYERDQSGSRSMNKNEMLQKQAQWNEHIAGCQYWWRFEKDGSQLHATLNTRSQAYQVSKPYESNNGYTVHVRLVSPSDPLVASVLAEALGELSPEELGDWERYALENWSRFGLSIGNALDNSGRKIDQETSKRKLANYELAKTAITRMKYELSDPATENEARRVLQQWRDGERNGDRIYGLDTGFSPGNYSYMNSCATYLSDPAELEFRNNAYTLLEKNLRVPLSEQWQRSRYMDDSEGALLVCLSGQERSSDYFEDFARYTATSRNGMLELLGNEDPRATSLFKTMLHHQFHSEWSLSPAERTRRRIEWLSSVHNPKTDPLLFRYIEEAFERKNLREDERRELVHAVTNFISIRTILHPEGHAALRTWAETLPMEPGWIRYAFRNVPRDPSGERTFSERIQKALEIVAFFETDLEVEDVNRWYENHPDGNLELFFREHAERIRYESFGPDDNRSINPAVPQDESSLPEAFRTAFVTALLQLDTEEAGKAIAFVWKNDEKFVLQTILEPRALFTWQLPTLSPEQAPNIYFPRYLLELFATADTSEGKAQTLSLRLLCSWLAGSSDSEAERILSTWSASSNEAVRTQAKAAHKEWQKRESIRSRNMELYRALVDGKIRPDDLVPPSRPWIWQDGRYVESDQAASAGSLNRNRVGSHLTERSEPVGRLASRYE